MWLLTTTTHPPQLKHFHSNVPEYVILSHTWGDEEVSFQELQNETGKSKAGYWKINNCCEQAAKDGFEFAWVDTCCIDKTSSAELSEAINSMFQWYKESSICYAYLEDVDPVQNDAPLPQSLGKSHWFRRGWTLQELIAPPAVEFYSQDWTEIGTKLSLAETISEISGIPLGALLGGDLSSFNFAEKMSWASQRLTTRIEDQAYCLMGLFGINMPLLYGEGKNAFLRLQEEIMKKLEDYTMFAWTNCEFGNGLLATSPSDFEAAGPNPFSSAPPEYRCSDLLSYPDFQVAVSRPPTMSPRGLNISLPATKTHDPERENHYLILVSSLKSDGRLVCIEVKREDKTPSQVITSMRVDCTQLIFLPAEDRKKFIPTDFLVPQTSGIEIPEWAKFGVTCPAFPRLVTITKEWPTKGIITKHGSRQTFRPRNPNPHPVYGVILFKSGEWHQFRQPVEFLALFGFTDQGQRQQLPWCDIITELPVPAIDTWNWVDVRKFSYNKSAKKLKDRVSATMSTPEHLIQIAVRMKKAPRNGFVEEYILHVSVSEREIQQPRIDLDMDLETIPHCKSISEPLPIEWGENSFSLPRRFNK